MAQTQEKGSQINWDNLYESNRTPWVIGKATAALLELINTQTLPDGLAVVPGCGLAHDVVALATDKRKVIGVDISPTAVERAREVIGKSPNAEVMLADFFTLDMDGQVDLLFDYTFLCALPPSMRDEWADKISKLLKSGGVLITLMFPLNHEGGGPPYPLSVEIYKDLLLKRGFELSTLYDVTNSIEARAGKEKMGVWKRT